MDIRTVTKIVLAVVVAALVVWDIVVATTPPPADTISEVVLAFARNHPVVPLIVGILCGHLFWPQRQ